MPSLMKRNVEAAQNLLRYLNNERGIDAVVAGGYARDSFHEKPVRDVDLYVSEEDFWSAADELFGVEQKRMVQNVEVDQDSVEYLHQSIVRQFEHELQSTLSFGLPTRLINLIGVNSACAVTIEDIIGRYNLGICKIGIDHSGMMANSDFGIDTHDKQITLLRTGWGHEATMKQFLKLQAKYPWPLRVRKEEAFNAF
jgi:hypothetical protein